MWHLLRSGSFYNRIDVLPSAYSSWQMCAVLVEFGPISFLPSWLHFPPLLCGLAPLQHAQNHAICMIMVGGHLVIQH